MRCIKYPLVKQEEVSDCGAACLSMIIKFYNGYVDMETLREMTNTDKSGVSAYHLIEASKKLNFEAYGIKCSLDDLKDLKVVLPCIAHVTINKTYQHYIVIYKINYHKHNLIIADPNGHIKRMTFEEFTNIWQGVLLILFPIKSIPLFTKSTPYQEILLPLIHDNKQYLFTVCLLSIILTIFGVAASFYFKYVIEAIINQNRSYLLLLLLIFSIVYFIKIVTDFYRNKLIIFLNQKIDLYLTMDTFKNIIHLPYRYYRNHTTGDIISRLNDLQAVRNVINKVAISLFVDLPLATITIFFLYMISPILLGISLVILLFYILIVFLFKHLFTNIIDTCQENHAKVTSSMIETINAFETVKGLDLETSVIKNNEHKYVSLLKSTFTFDNMYNIQYLTKEIINTIGFILIIYVGANLTLDGKLTLANLILFDTLLTNFLAPIRNIVDLDTNIKEANNALKRISNLKCKKDNNGHLTKEIRGHITFKHLDFGYNVMQSILKNIDFDIKVGEKVLILGNSGSGKSTLLKFLMQYYEVPRDTCFLDDADINDYDIRTIKENISYISQQETLFTDTLYNNIVLDRNIKNDTFLEITNMCCINEIIKNNNLGFNMLLEENGFNISGGERQRIILARTLLKDFNILLIDEGLNQIDINLERSILKGLFKKYSNKTIIIISHRLENMDLFNRVIEMQQGVIKRNDYKNG